jgi:hypothetical protein
MSVSSPKGFPFAFNFALSVVLGVLSNKIHDALKTSTMEPEVVVHCSSHWLL